MDTKINTNTNTSPSTFPARRRRPTTKVAAATALAVLLLAGGCGLAATTSEGGPTGAGAAAPTTTNAPTTSAPQAVPERAPVQGDAEAGDDSGDESDPNAPFDHPAGPGFDPGGPWTGEPDGWSPEPGGEAEPVDLGGDGGTGSGSGGPCAVAQVSGAKLAAGPDPLNLPSGILHGAVTITNCSTEAVDWTAATKPWVSLAHNDGNLAPGSTTDLAFTIDADAIETGAFTFKIKVGEAGHSHYVDVSGFRPTFGKDLISGGGQLTAGPEAGGCANQCITTALLSKNATSPTVGLEVKTHTAAKIKAYVSKNAPVPDAKGNPTFPGVAPLATSGPQATHWTTNLKPLQADTKYYLILSATSANNKTSYRTTSFRTITPYDGPGTIVDPGGPGGCGAQCITKARLGETQDFSGVSLTVETHTAARFALWASPTGTPDQAGEPVATSGAGYETTWSTKVTLPAGTSYVLLRATDNEGRHSIRTATFHRKAMPVAVTVQQVHILRDGDPHSAGEMDFSWYVGDKYIGDRTERMKTGARFHFTESESTGVIPDAVGFLPTIGIVGGERDGHATDFCTDLPSSDEEPGRRNPCGWMTNVATTGILDAASLPNLPRCSEFGIEGAAANDRCTVIITRDEGEESPHFEALLSFRLGN